MFWTSVSALCSSLIIAYTTVYAFRTWRLGNRRGGAGLLAFTAGVAVLAAYVLFFRP